MKNLDTIVYSNYFIIENNVFSFRKKELFNITNLPIHIPLKDNNNCKAYWINRNWYSLSKLEKIIIKKEKTVNVNNLQ